MQDFTVHLDRVFEGPMDLLLHLVREQEVEITEVSIHTVIDGYFAYLEHLKDLDIEVAGEFLVMAATLMAIKSRSLLPREEVELDDELDPEDELIQRLIEYRKFKGAADDLEQRYHRRSLEHERGFTGEARLHEPEKELDIGELTVWDLLATFSRLMRETLVDRPHTIKGDPRPLRWYVSTVAHNIQRAGRLGLRQLLLEFDEEVTREGLIGCFCALLELVKIGVVSAVQDGQEAEIELVLNAEADGDFDDLIRSSTFMDEEEPDEDDGFDADEDEGEEAEATLDPGSEEAALEDDELPDDLGPGDPDPEDEGAEAGSEALRGADPEARDDGPEGVPQAAPEPTPDDDPRPGPGPI